MTLDQFKARLADCSLVMLQPITGSFVPVTPSVAVEWAKSSVKDAGLWGEARVEFTKDANGTACFIGVRFGEQILPA